MSIEIVTNPYTFQLVFPIILVMTVGGLISMCLAKKLPQNTLNNIGLSTSKLKK